MLADCRERLNVPLQPDIHRKTCKIFACVLSISRALKGRWSWGVVRPLPSYQPGVPSSCDPFPPLALNLRPVFAKRTMLLHHLQELDDDLRARADQDLALAGLLGVVDGLERIVEDR